MAIEVPGSEKRIPYWPEELGLIRTEMAANDEIECLACLCFVVIVPPRTVPPAAVCNLLGGHPEQEEILGAGPRPSGWLRRRVYPLVCSASADRRAGYFCSFAWRCRFLSRRNSTIFQISSGFS